MDRPRVAGAPLPAARLSELGRAARDSLRAAEPAADQLEPREAAEARELGVGNVGQAGRLEGLGEVRLGVAQPFERDLREPEMREGDRAWTYDELARKVREVLDE